MIIVPTPKQREARRIAEQNKITLYGGAIRGGKSYWLCLMLLSYCFEYPRSRWLIVRESLPTMKRTILITFNEFLNLGFRQYVVSYDQQMMTVTFNNGSQIIFMSESFDTDKELNRFRGLEINGAGIDEINEVQEVTLNKIIERAGSWNGSPGCPVKILATCNPTNGWVKDKFYDAWCTDSLPPGFAYVPAKITDNPYLSAEYLESLKMLPDFQYKVFVEGNWEVQLEGLVYPDWIEQKEHPTDYDYTIYGLDFGFTNDPTALVRCDFSGRNIYLTTLIYETGLTNHQLLAKMHSLGLKQGDIIYADCAEPKSIAEITTGTRDIKGIYCAPAVKGSDSLRAGINKLSDYKIHYLNIDPIRKERNNYVWDKDANGKALNKPIDAFNHSLDASRYAIFTNSFTRRGEKKGK